MWHDISWDISHNRTYCITGNNISWDTICPIMWYVPWYVMSHNRTYCITGNNISWDISYIIFYFITWTRYCWTWWKCFLPVFFCFSGSLLIGLLAPVYCLCCCIFQLLEMFPVSFCFSFLLLISCLHIFHKQNMKKDMKPKDIFKNLNIFLEILFVSLAVTNYNTFVINVWNQCSEMFRPKQG